MQSDIAGPMPPDSFTVGVWPQSVKQAAMRAAAATGTNGANGCQAFQPDSYNIVQARLG
jgi:hypothetical protein